MNPLITYVGMLVILVIAQLASSHARHVWENPGCFKLGHTRTVRIPSCVAFQVTTNACRGFCTSYAIPSPAHTVRTNPQFLITSRAECCSIVDTHDVKVRVRCINGIQEFSFKSARTCSCSICRRS